MLKVAPTPTVSVNDVRGGLLPAVATGVRWTDTDWTECRAHLEDRSWSSAVIPSDDPTGQALTGTVECDACAERKREGVDR